MRGRLTTLRTAMIFVAVLVLPLLLTACGHKKHGGSWG
jgi:hypothetical protein